MGALLFYFTVVIVVVFVFVVLVPNISLWRSFLFIGSA